jgi:hypothetical protein
VKIFVKLMLFVVVAAVAAPFVIKGPDGRPLVTLDSLRTPDVNLPDFTKAADAIKAGLGDEPDKVKAVFKWQDEKGMWHFSDNKEQGRSAGKLNVDPNANLVHFAAAGNTQAPASAINGGDDKGGASGSPVAGLASLATISTLIHDAKNVDNLQKERAARQQRAMQ